MNAQVQRALLLFDQDRPKMAEAELRQVLMQDPHDAFAHALLGLCMMRQEQYDGATQAVQQAIHLAPDFPFAHYALACVYHERNRFIEARAALQEAIRLDPTDAQSYALLAQLQLHEKNWRAALAAAEAGLQHDSEHVACTNLRAIALVKLGRQAEAGQSIEAALARHPDNSVTHANQGWRLLEAGQLDKALEHFRESLRLDPDSEWARQGIVEALKAKNLVYAGMLRYFLWMSKLPSSAQWGIILGGYLLVRFLSDFGRTHPAWAPWILPVTILYVGFALLTWIADPLFNLMLRLNRFGRLVLSREQIVSSNWIGLCLAISLSFLVCAALTGFSGPYLTAALVFGVLVIPLAGTFKCATGWPRKVMTVLTSFLAVTGVGYLLLFALAKLSDDFDGSNWQSLRVLCIGLFLLGAIGSPWLANILIMQRPKK